MELGNPIATGNTATIYLWNNRVVKVFHDHAPRHEALYEANKQQIAYSCGLSVPRIFDVTEIAGKQAIIMEYVEGITLGDLYFKEQEKAEYYLKLSVNIQQEIHQVKTANTLETLTEKLVRQIKSAPLEEAVRDKLIDKMASISYESRLCHGDFHLFNVMKSDDRMTIIDWVDSSIGDIRADIYRTYLLYSQFSNEIAELYLQLYCRESGHTKEEIFQWAPIIAAGRLTENVSSNEAERLLKIIKDSFF